MVRTREALRLCIVLFAIIWGYAEAQPYPCGVYLSASVQAGQAEDVDATWGIWSAEASAACSTGHGAAFGRAWGRPYELGGVAQACSDGQTNAFGAATARFFDTYTVQTPEGLRAHLRLWIGLDGALEGDGQAVWSNFSLKVRLDDLQLLYMAEASLQPLLGLSASSTEGGLGTEDFEEVEGGYRLFNFGETVDFWVDPGTFTLSYVLDVLATAEGPGWAWTDFLDSVSVKLISVDPSVVLTSASGQLTPVSDPTPLLLLATGLLGLRAVASVRERSKGD